MIKTIRILSPNSGWETVSKEDYSNIMRELRKSAVEVIEKENVAHVIYSTNEYEGNEEEQILSVKPYLIKCTDVEFEDFCSRETPTHIIKAVHNHSNERSE